jgi:hypothetical protein
VIQPTCNYPLRMFTLHGPVCGKPAVARFTFFARHFENVTLYACEKHRGDHIAWESL